MTNRIDHAAEAERLLALNSPDAEARAQVHAMLALVEQQRIANLIALAAHGYLTGEALSEAGNEVCYEGLVLVQRHPATPIEGEDETVHLRPEVAAALGVKVQP